MRFIVTILASLLTLVMAGLLAGYLFLDQRIDDVAQIEPVTIEVKKGTAERDIGRLLVDSGVEFLPFEFELLSVLLKTSGRYKSGDFQIPANSTRRDILTLLTRGSNIREWITIPECITNVEVAEILLSDKRLSGDLGELPSEGMLSPNTYDINSDMPRKTVVARLNKVRIEELARAWSARKPDLPLASPEELLILASIVEKESGRASEQSKVAGVFVNRLKKNMKLQSDPTVIYFLTEGRSKLGREILRRDLERDNPYNTYTRAGLPPTPLCNPGNNALSAVAQYADTDALYFVADGEGGHWFAKSLREHNNNVRKYREKIRGQR